MVLQGLSLFQVHVLTLPVLSAQLVYCHGTVSAHGKQAEERRLLNLKLRQCERGGDEQLEGINSSVNNKFLIDPYLILSPAHCSE